MNTLKNQGGFTHVFVTFICVIVVLSAFLGYFIVRRSNKQPDITAIPLPQQIPRFVTRDFVDISKIYSISKFRSAEGHDFTDGTETCRSMKHYFNQQFDESVSQYMSEHQGMPPNPNGQNDVSIFAPFEGTVFKIETERMPIGEQLYLRPDGYPDYTVRLFHIYKLQSIKEGSRLKAGEKLGVIASGVNTDISVDYRGRYISYFDVLNDDVFSSYQSRGVNNREQLKLSKEYRDSHPVPCDQTQGGNQRFTYPEGYNHKNDIVELSGYIDPATFNRHNGSLIKQ